MSRELGWEGLGGGKSVVGFFDTVNHERLMNLLARRVADLRVLRLIGCYLRAGVVLPDGQREATTRGVPQGGPLSPLLANIMLDPLDKELENAATVSHGMPTIS